ncbi:MAG: dephospho-CoA kinase [Rhizobacter sp.]|nr:dephospho-CoA kinase [Ferruginibacter sp.]
MLKIGLTGGIGSGKSTVAKVFETLGIPVYYADDVAKRIMTENESVKQQVISNFGEDSYSHDELNRAHIAAAVFNNTDKLNLLNSIVHPVTIADAEIWMQLQQTPYAVKEAALIFEANAHRQLDYVIGVSSPVELRIRRVMERDGISSQKVQARMDKQMNEEEKMKRCDFIIFNDEKQLLIPQVLALHEKLIGL